VKGSTFKRCTCPPKYATVTDDATGKTTRKRLNCPKKHGSWSYVLDIGVDEATGKRKQMMRGGFTTQTAAQHELNELIAKLNAGTFVPDAGITVGQWLQQWLAELPILGGARGKPVKASTITGYADHVRLYLEPMLGRIRLRDLRPAHVQRMVTELTAGERSATTVVRVHAALSSALARALKRGLIAYNPAARAGIDLPAARKPKVNPWTGAELGVFLDSVGGHRMGALFEVMAYTGMRRGEAMGLRWSDVDFAKRELTVRQQIKEPRGRKPACPVCGAVHPGAEFDTPKSEGRDGTPIELDDVTVGALLAHKLAQDAEKAEWGDAYVDHDLVFARPNGDPLNTNMVHKTFHKLIDDAKLRRIRLHDLRHGHASLMLAGGVELELVSKRIGHSSQRITADMYQHLLPGVSRGAAQKAAALVPRKPREQSVSNEAVRAESAVADQGVSAGEAFDGSSTGSKVRLMELMQ
jgi:integrase